MKFSFRFYLVFAVAFSVLLLAYRVTQPRVIHFEHSISDPSHEELVDTRFVLFVPAYASGKMQIKVDGCLRDVWVNQKSFPWQKEFEKFCKGDRPLTLDFDASLVSGPNEVILRVQKAEPEGGFANLSISQHSGGYWLFYGLFLLLTATLFAFVWHSCFRDQTESRWIFVWSCLAFLYLLYTPWDVRANDPIDHIDYVLLVFNNFAIPGSQACWQCFQAPGYYFLSALLFKGSNALFDCMSFSVFLLQYFSLTLVFIFLVGVRRVLLEIGTLKESRLLFLFFLTTPSLLLHCARIGNDILFYVASIYCLLALLAFWKRPTPRSLGLAVIFVCFSLLAKATGLLLFAALTLLFMYLAVKTPSKVKHLSWHMLGASLLLGALYVLKTILWKDGTYFQMNMLSENLKVKQSFYHFLILDLSTFFREPYALPLDPNSGREYFWNYFLKSFSFGEFTIQNAFNFQLAQLRNAGIVLVLCYSAFLWTQKKLRAKALPVLIFSLCFIAGHLAYRGYHPYSSSADGRLIYPGILLFFAPLIMSRSKWIRYALGTFVGLGLLFWVNFFVSRVY